MARAFERPATIALPEAVGEGLALEGLFVPGESSRASSTGEAADRAAEATKSSTSPAAGDRPAPGGAVIAPPHPLMGGSMESPVVTEIAWACQQAGRPSLRFNWRGVGASGGAPSGDVGDADVDYASATRFLVESAPGPHLACGYSFGALAALRASANAPTPCGLVLIAPPTAMGPLDRLTGFAGETLILAGADDPWVDARALSALALDGARLHVEVIPDCDHFFMTGLGHVARALADWLDRLA